MLLELILVLPTSLASICPLKSHQVCNIVNYEDHLYSHNQCTCAITAASDRPAPEQSCTNLIRRDKHNNTFPVISLIFNLRNSPDINEFPEISFRETIAGALRVHPADILLLRVNCQGSENMLTVQFGILKKNNIRIIKVRRKGDQIADADDDNDDYNSDDDYGNDNNSDNDDGRGKKDEKSTKANKHDDFVDDMNDDSDEKMRYDSTMFVDAQSVAIRIKSINHLSQIADLQVESITFTEDIIDLEYQPDNSTLVIQAIVVMVLIVLMSLLGACAACHHQDYADDLQKNLMATVGSSRENNPLDLEYL